MLLIMYVRYTQYYGAVTHDRHTTYVTCPNDSSLIEKHCNYQVVSHCESQAIFATMSSLHIHVLYTQIGNYPLHEAVSKNRGSAVTPLLATPNGASVVNTANLVRISLFPVIPSAL